jgi:hypothetical protein
MLNSSVRGYKIWRRGDYFMGMDVSLRVVVSRLQGVTRVMERAFLCS